MSSQETKMFTVYQDKEKVSKRLKKPSYQDDGQSMKKLKSVLQNQSHNKKITTYFSKISKTPENELPTNPSKDKNSVQCLQQKLKDKEQLINILKQQKETQRQKIYQLVYQTKQFKKKTKYLIAKSMLDITKLQRAQRMKRNEKLGYFTEGLKHFVQGQTLTTLRRQIKQKQQMLKQLQEQKRNRSNSKQQNVRIISSLEFITRELNEVKKQLSFKEKQLAIYKDTMKLNQKEMNCHYNKLNWPIIYDRYQTLELLGSGGFGEVYKCFDLESNKLVALKTIIFDHKHHEEDKQDFFKRIKRQIEIQKKLDHPNIAKLENIVQFSVQTNRMVFEVQYCMGPQLSVYLRRNQCIDEKQAKIIIQQLFSAINYLYKLKQKVIHYDLKPTNIMFSNGVIKILDFGLCKVMNNSEQTKMDLTSQGVGTYWYLPPETFEDYNPQISSKVDVWSIGVIFYQLLYGRKPFGQGVSQNYIYQNGTILKAYKPQFPKQTPKKAKISEGAIQFITACLKYNYEQRLTPTQAYQHAYLRKQRKQN